MVHSFSPVDIPKAPLETEGPTLEHLGKQRPKPARLQRGARRPPKKPQMLGAEQTDNIDVGGEATTEELTEVEEGASPEHVAAVSQNGPLEVEEVPRMKDSPRASPKPSPRHLPPAQSPSHDTTPVS